MITRARTERLATVSGIGLAAFPGESVSLEQASGELMATMVLELRQ
jgi:hypothetical protein